MSSPLANAAEKPPFAGLRRPETGNGYLRCRVECVDHVGGNATAGGDIVTVAASPVANGCALLAVDRCPPSTWPGRPAASTSTDTAARLDPLLEVPTKFGGILGRKVDLVAHPIETEFHGLVGSSLTV